VNVNTPDVDVVSEVVVPDEPDEPDEGLDEGAAGDPLDPQPTARRHARTANTGVFDIRATPEKCAGMIAEF
jgi:hypothetical protein